MVVADCLDAERMDELLAGHEAFVHVAGILLGPTLARLPRLADPRHVVVVSSAAVHSAHRASAAAYRSGEDALRMARPDVALLRPTMIYGSPRDRNLHYVLAFARRYRFLPLFGDGSALVQPVHFEDVAAAVVGLIGVVEREPFEIGAATAITLRTAAETILDAIDAPRRILPVPFRAALGAARIVDVLRGSRLTERVERMLEDRIADNTRVSAATGVVPRNFAVGIRQQVMAEVILSTR